MVVVNGNLCKQTGAVRAAVVLGVELTVGNCGRLKVCGEGELKGVLEVGINSAVAVVKISLELNGVGGVVLEVVLVGVEADLDVCGINRSAVAIGLTDIGVDLAEHYLAGRVVDDGDLDLRTVTKKSRPDVTELVHRALLVGDRDILAVCRDLGAGGILNEVEGTEVADVVALHATDGTAGVCVGKSLVENVDSVVELILVGLEVIEVEDGSNSPIAVECKIRNAEVNDALICRIENHEALYVHTVSKGLVEILLVCVAECDGNRHVSGRTCADGDVHTVLGCARDRGDLYLCAAEDVALLVNGGIAVAGLVVADALGHNVCGYVVGKRSRAEVLNRKGKGVNAALAGIVAELELGLVHFLAVFICNDICVGVCDVIEVCEACALLSYCVGQTVSVINDVCGGHHKLVDECGNLNRVVRDLGEVLNHVLTDKSGNARDIR